MFRNFFRIFMVTALASQLFFGPVAAAVSEGGHEPLLPTDATQMLQRGSVYVYGDQTIDNLVPIRILGAVAKAGIHYVPPGTDIVTLLSLAGGTTEKAELKSISIKRQHGDDQEIIKVDLEKLAESASARSPKLVANDTVMVPQSTSFISDDTMRTVTVITGFATVFSAIVIGFAELKK